MSDAFMDGAGTLLILGGGMALIIYVIHKIAFVLQLIAMYIYATLKFSHLDNRNERAECVKDWLRTRTRNWL